MRSRVSSGNRDAKYAETKLQLWAHSRIRLSRSSFAQVIVGKPNVGRFLEKVPLFKQE